MKETINLLNEARHEITRLRRQNELLLAKVETMNLFAVVLHTRPAQQEQCACVDIAWQLEREAGRLTVQSCTHRNLTVTEDGGRCNDCLASLEYDSDSRNWVVRTMTGLGVEAGAQNSELTEP